MTKNREELVRVAHTAAALVFAGQRHRLTDAALDRARHAAFKAICQADRMAGSCHHPIARDSHGVATLAGEGVTLAADGWQKVQDAGGAAGIRRRMGGGK